MRKELRLIVLSILILIPDRLGLNRLGTIHEQCHMVLEQ